MSAPGAPAGTGPPPALPEVRGEPAAGGDVAVGMVDGMLDGLGDKLKTQKVLKRPAAAAAAGGTPAKKAKSSNAAAPKHGTTPKAKAKAKALATPKSSDKLKAAPRYPGTGYFEPISFRGATVYCSHEKHLWRVKPKAGSRYDKRFLWNSIEPHIAWQRLRAYLLTLPP